MCWPVIQWPSISTFFLEQFSYAVLYICMEEVLMSFPCFWWMYCFQYAFHFNPINVSLLWSLEGWWWPFRMHEFNRPVTIVITFFYHIASPPHSTICAGNRVVHCDVIYAVWVGPEYCLNLYHAACIWDVHSLICRLRVLLLQNTM